MSNQIVEATVPFWGTGRSRRSAVAASLQEIQRRRPPRGWGRPVCRWCQKRLQKKMINQPGGCWKHGQWQTCDRGLLSGWLGRARAPGAAVGELQIHQDGIRTGKRSNRDSVLLGAGSYKVRLAGYWKWVEEPHHLRLYNCKLKLFNPNIHTF